MATALTLGSLSAWAQEKEKPAEAAPQGPPPAMVRVGVVEQQQLRDHVPVVGRLQEIGRSILAAEESGKIAAVEVEQGQLVTAGKTVVARIDDVFYRIALVSAQAQLAQAQAQVAEEDALLEQAERDRQQLEELLQAKSAKPREVANARAREAAVHARRAGAQAKVQEAQATVQRVQQQIARLVVKAPFDGVVVQKLVEVGQWANAGTPLVEIITRGAIEAVVDVPEALVNDVTIEENIEVLIQPLSLTVQGQVSAVVPEAASAARTFPVKIRLDDQQGKLKVGMSTLAQVPSSQLVEVLTVPRDAVYQSATGTVVWANVGGTALPVSVRVLFGAGPRYAVQPTGSGPPLAPGMQVVVEGAERLFPTQPLKILESTTQPAGQAAPATQPAGH